MTTTGIGWSGELELESVGGGELDGEREGVAKSRGGGGKMDARAMLKDGVEDLDSPSPTADSGGEDEGVGVKLRLVVAELLGVLDSLGVCVILGVGEFVSEEEAEGDTLLEGVGVLVGELEERICREEE